MAKQDDLHSKAKRGGRRVCAKPVRELVELAILRYQRAATRYHNHCEEMRKRPSFNYSSVGVPDLNDHFREPDLSKFDRDVRRRLAAGEFSSLSRSEFVSRMARYRKIIKGTEQLRNQWDRRTGRTDSEMVSGVLYDDRCRAVDDLKDLLKNPRARAQVAAYIAVASTRPIECDCVYEMLRGLATATAKDRHFRKAA
jgi:hypothetical protein